MGYFSAGYEIAKSHNSYLVKLLISHIRSGLGVGSEQEFSELLMQKKYQNHIFYNSVSVSSRLEWTKSPSTGYVWI